MERYGLLQAGGSLGDDRDQFGGRTDHHLTSRDSLMFRYRLGNGSRLEPLSPEGASVPRFPVGIDDRSQNFVSEETHIFSPLGVGLTRFSFLGNKYLFDEHLHHTLSSEPGFQHQPVPAGAVGPPFINVLGGRRGSSGKITFVRRNRRIASGRRLSR